MNFTGLFLIIIIPIVLTFFADLLLPFVRKNRILVYASTLVCTILVLFNFFQNSEKEAEIERLELLKIQNERLEEEKRHNAEIEAVESKKNLQIKIDSLNTIKAEKQRIKEETEIKNEEERKQRIEEKKARELKEALSYKFTNSSSYKIESTIKKIKKELNLKGFHFKEDLSKEEVRAIKNNYYIKNENDVIAIITEDNDFEDPKIVITNDGLRVDEALMGYTIKNLSWTELKHAKIFKDGSIFTEIKIANKTIRVAISDRTITPIEVVSFLNKLKER